MKQNLFAASGEGAPPRDAGGRWKRSGSGAHARRHRGALDGRRRSTEGQRTGSSPGTRGTRRAASTPGLHGPVAAGPPPVSRPGPG